MFSQRSRIRGAWEDWKGEGHYNPSLLPPQLPNEHLHLNVLPWVPGRLPHATRSTRDSCPSQTRPSSREPCLTHGQHTSTQPQAGRLQSPLNHFPHTSVSHLPPPWEAAPQVPAPAPSLVQAVISHLNFNKVLPESPSPKPPHLFLSPLLIAL